MKSLNFWIFCLLNYSHLVFAQPFSLTFNYQPNERREAMRGCYFNYEKRFKTPGAITIAVAFGYSDTIDEGYDLVTDQFTMDKVSYQLTQPCRYDQQGFCDFKRYKTETNKPQHYVRLLEGIFNQELKIDFYMMNSSFDISNHANQSTYKDQQLAKSQDAQRFYGWALENADVVFYEGHSRDGGGPDFSPPRESRSGKVNYPWYRKNQPGLKFLLDSVSKASASPMMLGLFSCASQLHFQKTLEKHIPDSTTIMSTKVVEAQLTKEALLHSLESLLNFECVDQLEKRLRGTSFVVNRNF